MESGYLHGSQTDFFPPSSDIKGQLLIILLISQHWKLFMELHELMFDNKICPAVIMTPNI